MASNPAARHSRGVRGRFQARQAPGGAIAKVVIQRGRRAAPHCWRHFVFERPIGIEKPRPGYPVLAVSLFGFVFFFEVG
ncbi:MAG: hypothetical protein V9G98_10110 [Candidatus Competibacter sp.]